MSDRASATSRPGRASRPPNRPPNKEARAREAAPAPPPPPDRAVRVGLTPRSAIEGDPTIVVAPPAAPLRLFESELGETGILGGVVSGRRTSPEPGGNGQPFDIVVDGEPVRARLDWIDAHRAVLVRSDGAGESRTSILFGEPRRNQDGTTTREAVVGGWRFEVSIESERMAALRERSRRGGRSAAGGGRLEIRAIIPGRIVAVSVGPGDPVAAGQQLLVLEAMKMQNELRAPREGTVASVAVAVGTNVEVGDVLMVIE